jgi:hypothetical protein
MTDFKPTIEVFLQQMINALKPDNEIIQKAEKFLEEFVNSNPDLFVLYSLQVLKGNQNGEVCIFFCL